MTVLTKLVRILLNFKRNYIMLTYSVGDLCTLIDYHIKNPLHDIYIGQGCNCLATQGGGIARSFRKYPEILAADVEMDREFQDLKNVQKLGSYSIAYLSNSNIKVFNMYTQNKFYPRGVRHANYAAIGNAVLGACKHIQHIGGSKLYLPLIGAGLAGGSWSIIESILDDVQIATGILIEVVLYQKDKFPSRYPVLDSNYSLGDFPKETVKSIVSLGTEFNLVTTYKDDDSYIIRK